MKLPESARFSTVCIHAGQEPDPSTGAIITPIYQTATYVQEAVGRHKGFEYSRTQNPTRFAVERNIAAIERGKAGFAFASGMAAIDAVTTLLAAGDHVVVTDNTYGGTFRLFERVLGKYQLSFSYVDTSQLDLVERAIRRETKMLFLETPTNPVMRLTDLTAVSELAHRNRIKVVVDNTFASPSIQRPIEFGADLVVHSTTKYLNGHSDSVGGIVVAVDDGDIEWLQFVQNAAGAVLSPFDSWLVLRGTKTLAVRMAQHNLNGADTRGVPRGASEGETGALSGSAVTPPARAGEASDARVRRNAHVRRRIGGRRVRGLQARPAHGARREPRGGRNAHLPPGVDDARVRSSGTAREDRLDRRARQDFGGNRGSAGPDRRHRSGARGIAIIMAMPSRPRSSAGRRRCRRQSAAR